MAEEQAETERAIAQALQTELARARMSTRPCAARDFEGCEHTVTRLALRAIERAGYDLVPKARADRQQAAMTAILEEQEKRRRLRLAR